MNFIINNGIGIARNDQFKIGDLKGMLIPLLAMVIAGCNSGPNEEASVAPSPPALPKIVPQISVDEWTGRDRNAPFQEVKFNRTTVRVPTKYILELRNGETNAWGQTYPMLWLETSYPEFPKNDQYEDYNKRHPEKLYRRVFFKLSPNKNVALKQTNPQQDFLSKLKTIYPTNEVRYMGIDNEFGLENYKVWSNEVNIYTAEFFVVTGEKNLDGTDISFDCDVRPPSELHMPFVCRTGYPVAEDLAVSYSFPRRELANWKEIRNFVQHTVQISN